MPYSNRRKCSPVPVKMTTRFSGSEAMSPHARLISRCESRPSGGPPLAMERHQQDPLLIALQADALEAVLVVI